VGIIVPYTKSAPNVVFSFNFRSPPADHSRLLTKTDDNSSFPTNLCRLNFPTLSLASVQLHATSQPRALCRSVLRPSPVHYLRRRTSQRCLSMLDPKLFDRPAARTRVHRFSYVTREQLNMAHQSSNAVTVSSSTRYGYKPGFVIGIICKTSIPDRISQVIQTTWAQLQRSQRPNPVMPLSGRPMQLSGPFRNPLFPALLRRNANAHPITTESALPDARTRAHSALVTTIRQSSVPYPSFRAAAHVIKRH
jgi:hypothetical protein